jgi:hypothetical protein
MTLLQLPATSYEATPIFCKQFAAFVEIGTFVLFQEVGEKRKEVVGQILQVDMPSTIIVAIFSPFEDILLQKERPITEGPGRCLQEIIGTLSHKRIKTHQILNLAFVFSPQKLQELGAVLQGILNAFICRFSSNGASFKPLAFPCQSKDCPVPCSLTRKLFEDIERVWDVIVGVLNGVSELQGDHARVLKHTYCSPEFWSYLKYRTRELGIKIHRLTGKRIRCRLSHQMKRMKSSTPYDLKVFRFDTLRIIFVFFARFAAKQLPTASAAGDQS